MPLTDSIVNLQQWFDKLTMSAKERRKRKIV